MLDDLETQVAKLAALKSKAYAQGPLPAKEMEDVMLVVYDAHAIARVLCRSEISALSDIGLKVHDSVLSANSIHGAHFCIRKYLAGQELDYVCIEDAIRTVQLAEAVKTSFSEKAYNDVLHRAYPKMKP